MDLRLGGRTAVVTGASRGIGLAVTRALVAEGAHVVAAARKLSDGLADLGDAVTPVEADLTTDEGLGRLAAVATDVDVLVNNVGGAPARLDGLAAIADEDWWDTLGLNLMTAVRVTRELLPALKERRGSIVNVVSVNAVLADPAVMDYAAAKAALASFTKSLSKEVGPAGVRVNAVSPGPVETDLWLGDSGFAHTVALHTGGDATAVAASAVAGTATGRFTHPAEVADLVAFLASGRAGNITGAEVRIDGGLVSTL